MENGRLQKLISRTLVECLVLIHTHASAPNIYLRSSEKISTSTFAEAAQFKAQILTRINERCVHVLHNFYFPFLTQLSKGHPVILLADDIEYRFNICVSYM